MNYDFEIKIVHYKKLVERKKALENVDINALSLYTLGELRKTSSKEDMVKYKKAFETYFLKTFHKKPSNLGVF